MSKTFPARPAMLVLLAALWAPAAFASSPLSTAQATSLLDAAAQGDAFALEAALPRIRDADLALLARARIAAARMDAGEARALVERYLAARERTPAERALAWPIAADASFAAGDYAQAAQAARAWQQALTALGDGQDALADVVQMATLSEQLATTPAQQATTYAPAAVDVARDKAGLPRAQARINGQSQDAVLDTGANLSVVSLTTARKLGLRLLDGEASVGSAARAAVATRIGIADKLDFAGLSLAHVPFLVLDDAQLSMPVPGGYQIEAILGFPVLRELQRLTFSADGKLRPSRSERASAPGNLRLAGSDLYVDVRLNGLPVAMHLDSGGARSSLSSRFAKDHPALLKGLQARQERVAGAGGARARQAVLWPQVRVRIGGREATLPELAVAMSDAGDVKEPNLMGGDILGAFDGWTLDFPRMQLEVGAPKAPAAAVHAK